MHKAYLILAIVGIISGCATIKNPELDSAISAYNKGSYQTVIHYANQILSKDLYSAEAYLLRGKAYSQLNETEKALKDFNASIIIEPGFDAFYNRGLEFLKRESYPAALEDFDKAASINPSNSEVYFTRAYTKYLLDNLEGAIDDYNKVIKLDSSSFKSYINVGNIYGSLGYGDVAIKNFDKAVNLQPENPDGYFNRGNQKLIMGDLHAGILDLEKSLSIDNKNVNALFLLADLKIKADDNLGALGIYNRILEVEENPKALFSRAKIYLKLEDKNRACTDLNRAGELGYHDAYALINKYCVVNKKKK